MRRPSARLSPPMDAAGGPASYLLYTSGTTAAQGHHAYTTGGYLTQGASATSTSRPSSPDTDVHRCAADIGWGTGHSYIV